MHVSVPISRELSGTGTNIFWHCYYASANDYNGRQDFGYNTYMLQEKRDGSEEILINIIFHGFFTSQTV